MSLIDIFSIQNDANGAQLRNAFTAINGHFGSEIVDIKTIQNTQDKYSDRVATGRQLKNAFDAVNTAMGSKVVDVDSIQNVCDGYQLKAAFEAINTAVDILWPELVINGDFSDGATGWDGIAVTDGIANTTGGTGTQVISTEIGVEYEVHFESNAKGGVPQLAVQNGNSAPSPVLISIACGGNTWKQYSGVFTAGGPESIVVISNGSNLALWDNVSIKKIAG